MSRLVILLVDSSPGSRVWKVGFSGEADPRAVFWSIDDESNSDSVWDLDLDSMGVIDRKEASRLVGVRITSRLRETFSKSVFAFNSLYELMSGI